MLVLTAQRRGEVLDATCDEFDFKEKVWTVPGNRAKNGKANVVPLSDQALTVVTAIFPAAGIAHADAHTQSHIPLASMVTHTTRLIRPSTESNTRRAGEEDFGPVQSR